MAAKKFIVNPVFRNRKHLFTQVDGKSYDLMKANCPQKVLEAIHKEGACDQYKNLFVVIDSSPESEK